MGDAPEDLLRRSGLSDHSQQLWTRQVNNYLSSQPQVARQARQFIAIMDKYFADHAIQYKGGMRAISSDVLESPRYNQKITVDFVVKAMETISGPQLDEWRCRYVCHNKYGQRKELDRRLKTAA